MTTPLSRRRFLQASIVSAIGGANTGKAETGSGKKILVVGAGLAGLNAASIMTRWGFDVEVIEARNRVGGRLWTLDHVPGNPEGGGNVIGADYGRTLFTAQSLGVPLRTPPATLPSDYLIGGQRILRPNWPSAVANPLPESWRGVTPERLLGKLNQNNPLLETRRWHDPSLMADDRPADEGLEALGFPQAAIQLISANNSYGNRLEDTSLMALYRVLGEFGRLSGPALALKEVTTGNMRLPEAMANQLKRPVSLGDPVLRVTQSASGVSALLASGRSVEADLAILALPIPALKRIELSLPEAQADVLQHIAYHKVVQLHCIVEAPYWREYGESGSWWTDGPLGRLFMRPIPGDHRHNLTVWINGNDCDRLNTMNEPDCEAAITTALWKLVPAAREVTTVAALVRWQPDIYAGGSWAIWAPGQANKAHELARAPAGRLFFAGEHTAEAYRGIEGAMESGERVALEALRFLS